MLSEKPMAVEEATGVEESMAIEESMAGQEPTTAEVPMTVQRTLSAVLRLCLVLGLVAGTAVATACGSGDGGEEGGELALDTPEQRGSYAHGLNVGRQGESLPLDVDAFVAGVRDGLTGEAQLSDQEIEEAVAAFSEVVAESREGAAEDARKAGEEFLAENRQRPEVQVTDSGLQYEVLEEGDGPRPEAGDTVRVHYRGTTIDGEVFDESYSRGRPATFPLGQVIPGWTEGMQLMQVGAKYKFYVPAELAYGANPPPGAPFGPGTTLIFEVELLEIVEE